MSILKDDDLSIEAAKRATYRLHAVATKLNLEETQAFASLAKKRGCKRGDLTTRKRVRYLRWTVIYDF